MGYSGLTFSLVAFTVLHVTQAFIFDGDLFGGMGAAMAAMGGMGHGTGAMGGMEGAGLGSAIGGMGGLFGGGMGGAGGAMGEMEGFLGGGMDGMMRGAMGGSRSTMGGMDGMFEGLMGGGMGGLFGGGMGSGMEIGIGGGGIGAGMQGMFGQLVPGQKTPVTKKCVSPFWLKYCKCHFMCPKGHVSYGNCEDFKENAFLPTMCCPETVHYACVGFET
ncbi:acanthoscurrin-2-like [Mizuhopecten yessoensis]|uniref:Uncharacterized protein n=1 Tax=Mizuhopecten yessoensis TaxID=6573 RepID=A0A210QDH0_MIZYE|nr:acanthoscurrin-2-like [Mizuhopecten yessoensis]OWF46741.1 hypothetical protein KP79_PYT21237 [Mizuhopecten yessoensis]